MDDRQVHRVEEVLFSFTYSKRQQASRCNTKLNQLMGYSIVPELENSFDQVSHGGIMLELDRLEIDLGTLSEEDISEDLGGRIREILVQALKDEIRERVLAGFGNSPDSKSTQSQDFSFVALQTFFLKGYFPAWIDASMNLFALLNFMISNSPKKLCDLVLEVSRKSEAARKRIAFLSDPYFDQIIRILIPEDAQWVIGYRNTYLDIHQTESNLPGPSENLGRALNLFILTFVTRNSGTKFNRLSFSDRFLKSIAAHYNLDFREFIQEITKILRQNTIKNQLFRDFNESIIWVGEKNQVEIPTSEKSDQPSFSEFIAWLDQPKNNRHIKAWVEELAFSGFLFQELSARFPAFWRSLSKAGLTHLFGLLGEGKADKWLMMTYSYLAWNSRLTKTQPSDQLNVVKEIFDLAWERSLLGELSLSGLEGWFSVLATHAFNSFGTELEISQSLLSLGLDAGVSNPTYLLITAKSGTGIRTRNRQVEAKTLISEEIGSSTEGSHQTDLLPGLGKFHELALIDYLNSGMPGVFFRSVSKTDLQWMVAGMLKSHHPILLNLIRNSTPRQTAVLKKRLWRLLENLNRREVLDYMTKFAGPQTLGLLRFTEKWVVLFNPEPSLIHRLDREVWNFFLAEIKSKKQEENAGFSYSFFEAMDSYYSKLTRIQISGTREKEMIRALQKKLHLDKSLLIYFAQNQSSSPSLISRLEAFVAVGGYLTPGHSLLSLRQIKTKGYLQRLDFGRMFPYSGSSFSPDQVRLIVQAGMGSLSKRHLTGKTTPKDLVDEALSIVKRDFTILRQLSYSQSSGRFSKAELRESVRRIFSFSQSDPQPILQFLQRHKNGIPLILYSLYQNMNSGDWTKLAQLLDRRFPDEFKVFIRIRDLGIGSLPDALTSPGGKSVKGATLSLGLERIFNSSGGLDLKRALSTGAVDKLFPSGFAREVDFLLNLPSDVFFKKSVFVTWRKTVIISVLQFKVESVVGKGILPKSFWEIFLGCLKERPQAFSPGSVDWNYLINAGQLGTGTKTMLLRFFKDTYLKISKKGKKFYEQEGIAPAIMHLNEEGFLPWWSPVKPKSRLFFAMLSIIEHSENEDAILLVSLFSKGKLSRLLAGISRDQLKNLHLRLSSSAYRKHYASLIRAIDLRLERYDSQSGSTDPIRRQKILKQSNAIADLREKPAGELELWIRKQVNASNEAEILRVWFENDPKIQDQMKELLAWGRLMYFGNLNPGKWKLWVLAFGFEFYAKKGNSYSPVFLSQFLTHLTRNQGMINWKAVFHRLLKNKEFLRGPNLVLKDQILTQFPLDQRRKQEEPATGDQVRIANAGLILCWPFLSVLFSRLKLSLGGIIPAESQPKAVYLLQYLAYGHTDFPEYELVLNKILIGMKSSLHLERVELSSEEKDMAESLLQGMKGNWEKMKNASVEAIRETFLQREGMLELGSTSNILKIPKTGVDVLLDSISWNIAVVRLPWMEKSLEVKWR